ncbi:hypothetical protein DK926_23930 [Rhodococcus sp. Eu-32]|uniref:hypothetical protein n=1 Tax=Rhodococcus sp. Eu-32 TaxID=1017319 RepID=UPI000F76B912|nr:hypothetical protein [Rhodococcus sp. Eu-32]RRQ25326.1 hypothetical protein DK926_23930 [Rhodococcus sp. Eu-32]
MNDDVGGDASLDWPEIDPEEESDLELDSTLDATATDRVTATLPDGRTLVVRGPGAGTAIVSAPNPRDDPKASNQIRLRTRDQALDDQQPIFILHCPHQNRATAPRAAASIVAATGGSVAIAASVRLPSATSSSHATWLNNCAAASIRIADPSAYLLDRALVRVKKVSARSRRWADYLNDSPLNVVAILDAQRSAGANMLLSAGSALDPGDPRKSLDAAFAQADDTLSELRTGERMALNLTVTSQWLQSPVLREALFAELLDQEQFDVWHIRVQWPSTLGTFEQPRQDDLLEGYKRLAQLASDEDRVLLLPQSGTTGWLQLAFGASGYGAGLFNSAHAFKEESDGPGFATQPIPRYFEASLLHPVERSVHDVLAKDPSYVPCDCPYCPSLLANPDWNHELSRLHHLYWMGCLAGIGSSTGRSLAAAIRRAVRDATALKSRSLLTGTSDPKHLPVWDHRL